ncbi:MAG: UspA domain protein [Myxococcales bacterium]|nr:UspA domain protein [Myxococcales bacterium]
MHIRHIFCPTDFSAGSHEAFETALVMATDSGARLTLFHVLHVPPMVFPDVMLPTTTELMRELEEAAEHQLQALCARARAAGVVSDYQTAFGTTHAEICAAAEQAGVDLIVIGTHGRGGFSHAILGSVAEKVVRKAQCPVLTVRSQMHSTFAHQ